MSQRLAFGVTAIALLVIAAALHVTGKAQVQASAETPILAAKPKGDSKSTEKKNGKPEKPPAPTEYPPMPQVPMLSPEQERAAIQVPEGYKLELVLSEPQIREPVLCAFDGQGRLYVAEMRTYMQDIDGTNEQAPTSRISMHEDTDGDGVYDRHTVFIDKLVLPRMILPLDGRIVVNETNTNDLYAYTDSDGDGVADKKEPFYLGGPRGGNLEHQQSGLIWGIDNWIYQTTNTWRLRWTPAGVIKESTPSNGGQWGLTQDDYGKPWIVNAGGEKGPWHYQTHFFYGTVDLPDQSPPDFAEVWPLVAIPDVQGGPIRYRPEEKTLNHFTATCGAAIYRGDRLPAELKGDLFFGEPVGRLIRRAKVQVRDGVTYLSNPHGKSEFIRSADPNFRPINMTTAPDGTLYIVDMYRGIIQEGNWVKEGSYLRKVVKQYGFHNNIGGGRIWRLVHKDFKPDRTAPNLVKAASTQLLGYLSHPNGWWRDTAQQQLVLRQDKTVVSSLIEMAHSHSDYLARIHAMWTLEGMDAADATLLRMCMKDSHPQVRCAAIRAAETLLKKGDNSLQADILAMRGDPDPGVVLQTIMTARVLKWPEWEKAAQVTVNASASRGVKDIGKLLLTPQAEVGGKDFSKAEIAVLKKGQLIYNELCFACHGFDGKGMPMAAPGTPGMAVPAGFEGKTLAPPLAGSHTLMGFPTTGVYVLLHGLAGPVNGKTYDALMVPMASNDDEWIASVLSYVRNSFNNSGRIITAAEVKAIRETYKDRSQPWTIDELKALLPHPLNNASKWKLMASHNLKSVANAVDGKIDTRYDTGKWQEPGMWFQVELPEAATISGIKLDAGKSRNDYPREYKVELSNDGKKWGKPVAKGSGIGQVTDIEFAPVKTKFIRITQTGQVKGKFWSIHEMQILQPGKNARPLAGK